MGKCDMGVKINGQVKRRLMHQEETIRRGGLGIVLLGLHKRHKS